MNTRWGESMQFAVPQLCHPDIFSSPHVPGLKFPVWKNNGFVSEHPWGSFFPPHSQQFWSVHRALRQWEVQWLRDADTGNGRPGSRKNCPVLAWRAPVNESTGTGSHAAEEMSLKRVFSGDFSEAPSDTQEWEQGAGFEPVGGCCLTADCSRICW